MTGNNKIKKVFVMVFVMEKSIMIYGKQYNDYRKNDNILYNIT